MWRFTTDGAPFHKSNPAQDLEVQHNPSKCFILFSRFCLLSMVSYQIAKGDLAKALADLQTARDSAESLSRELVDTKVRPSHFPRHAGTPSPIFFLPPPPSSLIVFLPSPPASLIITSCIPYHHLLHPNSAAPDVAAHRKGQHCLPRTG